MCAIGLRLRGTVLGALNLFRVTDMSFGDTDLVIATAMAKVAAIGLLQQRSMAERLLGEQLPSALRSRVVIEQAKTKGMLAEYLSINIDAAYQSLRHYARDNHLKITEVARDVATGRIGGETINTGRRPG